MSVNPSSSSPYPLFIFGLDAGDFNWITTWAGEGYLPALASIMESGCWGRTGGAEMVSEHGIWHSLFSGVPRGRHGCYYFRQLQTGNYNLAPFTGHNVAATPFWNELRCDSDEIAIIDVPDMPLQPSLQGVQLTNWATHRGWVSTDPIYAPQSSPPDFLEEVKSVAGARRDIVEKTESTLEEDRALFRDLMARVQSKGAVCRCALQRILQSHKRDNDGEQTGLRLAVMMLGESHTAAHQFWKYRPEAPESARKETGADLRHAIRDIYCAIDRELSALLELLPPDTHIGVVSSLGLEPHFPYEKVTQAACHELGYQVRASTSLQSSRMSWKPLDVARRVLPESWRVAASRYLSREAREKLYADQFQRETDWSRTKAFVIPSFYTGFIRVNLKGREPEGTVAANEYSQLLNAIADDFYELRDAATGEKIVRRVWRAGEVFGQEPPDDAVSAMPDLLIDYQPTTVPRERIIHPKFNSEISITRGEFFRDSDHSQQGFLALSGPNVKACGDVGEIELLNLAPTFLHLLGRKPSPSMSGEVLNVVTDEVSGCIHRSHP